MLVVCDNFSKEYCTKFNATKSKLLTFGNCKVVNDLTFQGNVVPHTDREKHVGILVSTSKDIHMTVITNACNDMYSKFNVMYRQMHYLDKSILYKMFNTHCLSLYGYQTFNFSNKRVMNLLFIAWRKCIKRMLNIPFRCHIEYLHVLCNDETLELKLHRRFVKFVISIHKSKNCIIRTMDKVAVSSTSTVSESLKYICERYSMNRFKIDMRCIKVEVSNEIEQKATLISDLISLRDSTPLDEELNMLIEHLCVN